MTNMLGKNCQIIKSVGIDIGTTTTQLVISKITIQNTSPGSSVPRMEITEKEVLYRSLIHFTPLKDHQVIDTQAIAGIVEQEYKKAGFKATEIDTGAVIVTGETAKKENAKNLVESMAGLAGDFVVATAGVNLESILAGKGSGAALLSKQKHCVVTNIDVGGGTSNIGVFKDGQVIDAACINIGGHIIELEQNSDKIKYIAQPARVILRSCGFDWQIGERVELEDLKKVANAMAKCIFEAISSHRPSEATKDLMMTPFLKLDYANDIVMFSGGVADYVYQDFTPIAMSQVSKYGDMGPLLGWAIREEMRGLKINFQKPEETIRATVIGAGAHSVNISGSTINFDEQALPMRNLTVIAPFVEEVPEDVRDIADAIKRSVERLLIDDADNNVALAITGPRQITYKNIEILADGIMLGMKDYLTGDRPLVIVLQKDCAKALGQSLKIKIRNAFQVVCIDQVFVAEGDYLDIGKPIMNGRVVPVVVKTLVFDSK